MNNEFDFTVFGDDADTIRELIAKPEDVHKLLQTKRAANGEAKQLREQLEQTLSELQERETEMEKRSEETRRELSISNFKIEALRKGIRPDRLSAAIKLIDPTEKKPEDSITELRMQYPELFIKGGSPAEVDNSGFSRGGSDDFEIARKNGDIMGMLKSLRKAR